LNQTRDTIIVAGLGGGGSFPKAISWQEIESWSNLTGNIPNRWELRALRLMDNSYLLGCSGKGSGQQHQAIGDYCNGADVEECRKMFGEQLERVCSTCPE